MKATRVERTGGALTQRALALVTSVTFVALSASAAEKPFAAPQATEHVSPTSAGSLLQVTFSLALVLALVFVAAWLVRKFKGFGRFGGSAIRIVADTALGPKERAVVIQVGEQQLLLGVTQQQVNLLHVLPAPVGPLPNPPPVAGGGQGGGHPGVDFAAILRRSLGLK
ncbi:flagellar biosynthetic protein FliO [Povalibacter sp.]|uniref:flagellar biosynthetic protein FliO n=1 Tax=Povalibacter sp. TaxID=1962978 RepID=UPI002D1FBB98|nr:flagellar biosynthetic protein FliO [Povalibacter sp.]